MIVTRNEMGKFTEFVVADVPVVVCEEGHIGVDILRHLDSREIVGIRLYDIAQNLVDDHERMEWLTMQHVEVRTPLRYGSAANFVTSPEQDDDIEHPSDLRKCIDAALSSSLETKGGGT